MKATYQQKGETLYYTPEENVESGAVVDLGTRIGIAGAAIPSGEAGNVHVVGVFAMTKAEGEAIDLGAAVCYDSAADAITAAADGNTPAGYAVASAAATDSTVLVKLLG